MGLESCMILLDNSEYMRNGDYIPTRLEAQSDAANLIVNQKTGSNPESTVGVISMSSSGPSTGAELLVSPTDDLGKILTALHGVPLSGEISTSSSGKNKDAVDIAASVQVAALALKHRRNKNGSQRIVLFVGSPLSNADKKAFVKAGKQLKKNNVFIDVIALGELEENESKLRDLVDAANGTTNAAAANAEGGDAAVAAEIERTCHLVTIPAGVLPSDVLVTSPILRGDSGGGGGGGGAGAAAPAAGGGGGGGDFAEFGGIDPSMDPELAMALRVSMEEERARQERVAAASNNNNEEEKSGDAGDAEGGESAPSGDAAMEDAVPLAAVAEGGEMDEDALLQQALAMSMAEANASGGGGKEEKTAEDVAMDEDDDEDAAMQAALAMSMGEGGDDAAEGSGQQQLQDPAFVNQLLGSLPGVNPDDPAIQEALRKANEDKKDDEEGKKDE